MNGIDGTTDHGAARHVRPGWFTQHVFNPAIRGLTRLGLPLRGSRILWVVGRSSGVRRSTVVNPLVIDGTRYLVAPRGNTQWVRNVRAAGRADLQLGRRHEAIIATELDDADKAPVLKEYVRRWKAETGVFFGGIDPAADLAEFAAIAPDHPVFVVTPG